MSIDCSNEWFPRQAAQELANEDIDIRILYCLQQEMN